nr:MAG TPA: hypothetical protein [Caudoviricetes sp.]
MRSIVCLLFLPFLKVTPATLKRSNINSGFSAAGSTMGTAFGLTSAGVVLVALSRLARNTNTAATIKQPIAPPKLELEIAPTQASTNKTAII